jgi:hypothetical protein
MCSTFSLSLSLAHTLLPSGIVHVLATLTEAPDSAIWRNTGVEAAGDVAAIRASSPFEIKRKKQTKKEEKSVIRKRRSESRETKTGRKKPSHQTRPPLALRALHPGRFSSHPSLALRHGAPLDRKEEEYQ